MPVCFLSTTTTTRRVQSGVAADGASDMSSTSTGKGAMRTTPSSRGTIGSSSADVRPLQQAVVSPFFVKERERLITEIADGMEQVLGNVNTLNRKLEESVTVGQEFEPIANLWGPFVEMLTSHGLTPSEAIAAEQQKSANGAKSSAYDEETAQAASAALAASVDGPSASKLPPGVAPGGGTVYGS